LDTSELDKAMRIQMIICPSFDCMLYFNPETKEYSTTKDGVLPQTDSRLVDYLKILPNLNPVNMFDK